MKFLIFLSLFLLINARPQYPQRPVFGIVKTLQDNIPFFESVLLQENRETRQPHETGEDHVHSGQAENTHGSNAEHDFHFDEMPMKSFVQLGPNESEDKQPLPQ